MNTNSRSKQNAKERKAKERTNVQETKKRKEWKMLYTFGYKINIVHNAPE